ncbi:MAG: MBOAT family protein [Methylococcales bacterium]|jgi:alginate O-acetyltransferase complex protein AlgI|nr:MBOAT family protein [Methylococcales bacterium]MBT7445658.1 MBOAT family protein [Methylococcales bacterium]
MLFYSYEFILAFLPVTFFVYFYLNQKKKTQAAQAFLLCASLFFYAWWSVWYLPIILLSIGFNFSLGKMLFRQPSRWLLLVGVFANLGLLGYFKYADFLIGNINSLFETEMPLLSLALPLAISFFTFQQIAYLVDSYYRKTQDDQFVKYAVFVTFFPQLIAGPIVHHEQMMPQFHRLKNKIKSVRNIALGLFIFSIGLFKKLVIADTFAVWANAGFNQVDQLHFVAAWIASLSYSFQLYFDFSGYADMAIGLALLFNIRLPINFNSPYKALDIQAFWRRWHMTLSRFLRDYIYIPLGGNRKGEWLLAVNLFVTFLIGGLWHGAGWQFFMWGAMHGAAIVLFRFWAKLHIELPDWFAWFITFMFVNIAWIFFRADSFNDAVVMLEIMFQPELTGMFNVLSIVAIVVGFGIVRLRNSNQMMAQLRVNMLTPVLIGIIMTVSLLVMDLRKTSEFLYFQF